MAHSATDSTPSVFEPLKPVFDQQKFENLLKDTGGALKAEGKPEAQKVIDSAKQMSPNDLRIKKLEERLKQEIDSRENRIYHDERYRKSTP